MVESGGKRHDTAAHEDTNRCAPARVWVWVWMWVSVGVRGAEGAAPHRFVSAQAETVEVLQRPPALVEQAGEVPLAGVVLAVGCSATEHVLAYSCSRGCP